MQQRGDAFRRRYRGVEDVELLAEVLNRPEEALRKHGERGENAKSERAGQNMDSTRPKNERNGGEAEKFDRRIEQRVSENGVGPGEHIVAIALLKFLDGFAFAVEELHNAHAGNVFLKKSVDAGNGRANPAIGVADELAKNHGDDEDAGQDGKSIERKAAVDLEEQSGHDHEEEEIVDHGNDAGGEEIVEGIDVRGHARDQPADGIAVEITHRQTLQAAEYFAAHVVHGLRADALHDANLDELGEEIARQYGQKRQW